MGFWNKLGKIALQAAPYVAAPFTGGASLMATGATQKLGQKWAEHDAKKAIEKGIAPSKFDKYLGMASAGAGLGSIAFGGALSGLGKAGSVGAGVGKGANLASIAGKAGTGASVVGKAGNVAKIANAALGKGNVGGWQGALGKIAGNAVTSKTGIPVNNGGWESQLGGLINQVASARNPSGQEPVVENNRPIPPVNGYQPLSGAQPRGSSLANSIMAGRNVALMSQPWRSGYETKVQGPEDENGVPSVITANMPAVYPNYTPAIQSPPVNESGSESGSIFADQLTPRQPAIRRRKPVEEEEY